MADKKISQLEERATTLVGADLLTIVGNTTTAPTNYRVQVKNFLSKIVIDTPATNTSALLLTANVAVNTTSAILAAAEFALTSFANTPTVVQDRYGLIVRNEILNSTSNVTGQFAAAVFRLDTGNSATIAANTFGILIDHTIANTSWARRVSPRAYIGIKETAGTNGNTTTYLLDVGLGGTANVSANLTNANATPMLTLSNTATATHKIKVNINGINLWLHASSTP
jgi:hypothetical protein